MKISRQIKISKYRQTLVIRGIFYNLSQNSQIETNLLDYLIAHSSQGADSTDQDTFSLLPISQTSVQDLQALVDIISRVRDKFEQVWERHQSCVLQSLQFTFFEREFVDVSIKIEHQRIEIDKDSTTWIIQVIKTSTFRTWTFYSYFSGSWILHIHLNFLLFLVYYSYLRWHRSFELKINEASYCIYTRVDLILLFPRIAWKSRFEVTLAISLYADWFSQSFLIYLIRDIHYLPNGCV